jgi:DNA replication and repair protein RecF
MTAACAITRLVLSQFRSFEDAVVRVPPAPVALIGANGIGKTNVLEALSLLSPGRGLRGATLAEMARQGAPAPAWSVAVTVEAGETATELGTGVTMDSPGRRTLRRDGAPSAIADLPDVLTVLWLTPAQDRLFLDGASARRRWLDRLVLALYPQHAGHVARYEHAQRERARLLAQSGADPAWLRALEARMAEHGVAAAAARRDTLLALAPALAQVPEGAFPAALATLVCPIADALGAKPALDVEDDLKMALADCRAEDARTGRTAHGAHLADLAVLHGPKQQPAALCSTGEQKALLISLLLGQALLVMQRHGRRPILLLDEIAAHLDADRRAALFHRLLDWHMQAWVTGTDRTAFEALEGHATLLTVRGGTLEPLAA